MKSMWMTRGVSAMAVATTLMGAVGISAANAAPPSRSFDTDADGTPELTIYDTDGDGFFEWPAKTTYFPGLLEFVATDKIAFSGLTGISAREGVTYAAGSQLVTLPGASVHKVTITSTKGSVIGSGLLDFTLSGDFKVTAAWHVQLAGITHVSARNIKLTSKNAEVLITQPTQDDFAPGAFAMLASNKLSMLARGGLAGFYVAAVRLGAHGIDMIASSRELGGPSRAFFITDALITTDPSLTHLAGPAGGITMSSEKQTIEIQDGSVVDSAGSLVFKTPFGGFLLVFGGSRIEANEGAGTINTVAIRNLPVRDAASTVSGNVVGQAFVVQ